MAMKPDDSEVPHLRRLQDWWLELPLSYRLNALLYFLGVCFMVFLLTVLLGGGDTPRQIQVGAGVPSSTTTTTTRPAVTAPTTAPGSSTSSTGPTPTAAGGTTTTARALAGGGAATGGGSSGGGGGGGSSGGGGGGGGDTTVPVAASTTVANTVGTVPAPTTTQPPCRNSTDQACGQFQWSPGPNSQPVNIGSPEITPSPQQPNVEVTFRITVTDPDHTVGTCAMLDFGDLSSQGSCPEPPCPARYGTWDLPAPGGPGSFTFTFTHVYKTAGPYIATFLVDDRNDCWDPYGERRTRPIAIVVG